MVTKGNKVVTNDFPFNFQIYFFNVMYTFTKANATQQLMNTRATVPQHIIICERSATSAIFSHSMRATLRCEVLS